MTKTTVLQKIGLFFFALILTLFFLEITLRLGGWAFLALQENSNRKSVNSDGEFRILCLGESTTALGGENSYPRQLEKILNSRQNLRKFKVINKGVPATTTDQILAKVPSYLDEYRPDMVVSMMGINDPQDLAKRTWRENLSRYSKAFKLFDMIAAHWSAKKIEGKSDFVEKQIAKFERQAILKPSSRIAVELAKANLYRSANEPDKEKQTVLKILSIDDKNSQAWHLLGIYYQRHAEYQKALEAFEKSYIFGSSEIKISSLDRMAQAYKFLNEYEKAQKIYQDILSQQPTHPEANGALADIYLEQGELSAAIKFYEKQLEIAPRSVPIYGKLAHCYRRNGKQKIADAIFELGAKVNRDDPEFFYEWGYALLEGKKYSEAENVFKQALLFNKTNQRGVNERIKEALLKCYQAQNKMQQAAELKTSLQKYDGGYNPVSQKNYLQLTQILAKRRIALIAVQYPNRAVLPLEEMLANLSEVVIVDNQQVFEDALKKYPYDDLFTDRFAGDFGHCTTLGNALLAGHVAEAILNLCKY